MADNDSSDLNQTLSEAQQALQLNTNRLDDPRIKKDQPFQPGQPPQAQAIKSAQDPTSQSPSIPGASPSATDTPTQPTAQTGGSDPDPSAGKPATYADLQQHTYQMVKEAEAAREKADQYYRSMQAEIKDVENTPYPQMPKEEPYPQAPNAQAERKQGAKASIAFILLAIPLAIAMGRKGPAMWGAMNGIGEGLKAIKDQNNEKMQQNYNLWRASYEQIHQTNTDRFSRYKELMSLRNNSVKEKMEAIKTLADSYNDVATSREAEAKDWEGFLTHMAGQENLLKKSRDQVLGRTNQITKLFESQEGEYYRSAMAEKYPDLASGLYSNDPQKQGIAWEELLKRGENYWKWHRENRRYLGRGETEEEKDEDLLNKPPKAIAKPSDDHQKLKDWLRENFLKDNDLGTGTESNGGSTEPESDDKGFDETAPFGSAPPWAMGEAPVP